MQSSIFDQYHHQCLMLEQIIIERKRDIKLRQYIIIASSIDIVLENKMCIITCVFICFY